MPCTVSEVNEYKTVMLDFKKKITSFYNQANQVGYIDGIIMS